MSRLFIVKRTYFDYPAQCSDDLLPFDVSHYVQIDIYVYALFLLRRNARRDLLKQGLHPGHPFIHPALKSINTTRECQHVSLYTIHPCLYVSSALYNQ